MPNKTLKGFVVVLDSTPDKLAQIAAKAGVSQSALCYPDPATRVEDLQAYKVNPAAANTILVYKNYEVQAKFVNLPAQFRKAIDAGVFGDRHVELLGGVPFIMSGNPPHILACLRVHRAMAAIAAGPQWVVKKEHRLEF